jgi:hypothetical protein
MTVLRNRYPSNIPPAGADPLLKIYIRASSATSDPPGADVVARRTSPAAIIMSGHEPSRRRSRSRTRSSSRKYARVLKPYSVLQEGDLSLEVGQVLVIKTQNTSDHRSTWAGYIRGQPERRGVFPRRHVELLPGEPADVGSKYQIHDAISQVWHAARRARAAWCVYLSMI